MGIADPKGKMKSQLLHIFKWGVVLAIASGCMRSHYCPPSVNNIPSTWKREVNEDAHTLDVDFWWEVFEDPLLNSLEEHAVAQNQDLRVAIWRVVQERALSRVAGAALYPHVNLDGNYDNRGYLINPNIIGVPNPTGNKLGLIRIHQQQYSAIFDMTYELDIWGKLIDSYDAAVATAQASQEEYYTVLLILTADVALQYYTLRGLDAEDDLLVRTIKLRQEAFEINRNRYEAGLVNYSDVSRAKVELDRAISDRLDVERRRDLAENQLAYLLGISPSELEISFDPLGGKPPAIPPGLPSEILLRRPDVAEAERKVAAAFAQVGVARADLYPAVQLTGGLGFLSPEFDAFLSWQSRFWQMGMTLAQRVFDAGRTCANIEAAKAFNQETIAAYLQTIVTAFREVEDALSNLEYQQRQSVALDNLVNASQETSDVITARYKSGLTTYLDVVEADRSLLEAQTAATQLMTQRYLSTVALIKAIGGCF